MDMIFRTLFLLTLFEVKHVLIISIRFIIFNWGSCWNYNRGNITYQKNHGYIEMLNHEMLVFNKIMMGLFHFLIQDYKLIHSNSDSIHEYVSIICRRWLKAY